VSIPTSSIGQGPRAFLSGVSQGTRALFGHTSQAIVQSFAGVWFKIFFFSLS